MNFPTKTPNASTSQPKSTLPLMFRNYAKATTGQTINTMDEFSAICAEQILKNNPKYVQNEHSN